MVRVHVRTVELRVDKPFSLMATLLPRLTIEADLTVKMVFWG